MRPDEISNHPLTLDADIEKDASDKRRAEHQGILDSIGRSTIMMVDDDESTIDIIQMFLEEAGYTNFISTCDSTTAMSRLEDERPNVLLLDLVMPEVHGFDILEQVRNHPTLMHTPIIVLTSSTDAETKLKALELGATDFLGKPVDPSELVLRLRNSLAAKAYQDRLAYYDGLTGLPNRQMLIGKLERLLQRSVREEKNCAVFHLNLDRFKQINDALGHRAGDMLLRMVTQRLEECLRPSDIISENTGTSNNTLSRIGGDEFIILLTDIDKVGNASQVARRVLGDLEKPFILGDQEFFVTSSIGIAVFPTDGDDVETMLKHAAVAMSHAKRRGRNTFQFYAKELNTSSKRRLGIESQLRKALDRDEIMLNYQPKVDIRTGAITGAEALMRWQHRELGMISPGEFIPIAEETGIINDLGEWALYTATQRCKDWHDAGFRDMRIAVNVSGQQFRKPRLIHTIRSALSASGLEEQYLVVELTESSIMGNPEESVATLNEIKSIGLQLSVDDFGTGYSSLSYLKRFPLDELKVDRSFIKDTPGDLDDAAITTAIIALAHSLGLHVTAEGVETEPQLQFLHGQGCDEYQGFYFSKPLPDELFLALLRKNSA